MKAKRILAVALALSVIVTGSAFSIAQAKEKPLIKEYTFKAESEDNLSYEPKKEIKVDGQKYILKGEPKLEVVKSNKITEKRTVTVTNKEDLEDTITVDGVELKLSDVKWSDAANRTTITNTYDSQSEIPDSITSTKSIGGKTIDITLAKSNTETFTTPQNFTAPAYFTGHPDSPFYIFNGKQVTLQNGQPKWNGWQSDVSEYLGINNSQYTINSISWAGDFTSNGNGEYNRTATVSGVRQVPGWNVTYTETDDTATTYTAEATYEGIDPDRAVEAKAIAEYEKAGLSTIVKVIFTAAGILVAAGLIIAILFAFKKKRRSVNE